MSKRFIAYFDYLGFKDFIMNNPVDYQVQYVGHIFRDIENALAKKQVKKVSPGKMVANLENSKLHCINFSDTVIFYTNDDSEESLREILEVADIFNWTCILHFFPVRGCLYFGECVDRRYNAQTGNTGTYSVNSLIGVGLINAYCKAENQSWAGTVIDPTVIEYIEENIGKPEEVLKPYAKKYTVPYKVKQENQPQEWVFNLLKVEGKLGEQALVNWENNIRENFAKHKKSTESQRVKEIIENTIAFLKSYA